MSKAAFLTKLQEVAPELLPFVCMFYGRPSTYSWWDDQGRCRDVKQGEGCEQGDPLAPAYCSLWASMMPCTVRQQAFTRTTAW